MLPPITPLVFMQRDTFICSASRFGIGKSYFCNELMVSLP